MAESQARPASNNEKAPNTTKRHTGLPEDCIVRSNAVVSGCAATKHQETLKPLEAVRLTYLLDLLFDPIPSVLEHEAAKLNK